MESTGATNFIQLARHFEDAGMYRKAFVAFLVALSEYPELAAGYRHEFRFVLDNLNQETLERGGSAENILMNFDKAIKIYPECLDLCHDIGRYLYKFGYIKEALAHFSKVLRGRPSRITVEKNVNSAKNMLVDRWHFRMLNDSLRNEAYRQAIHKVVVPKEDTVIDVGSGTGLLSIYAHEAGAKNIVGCDDSEIMATIAKNILYLIKLRRHIKIVHKMSTSMSSRDLKGKATLLLTELFDAGLFGEHVLQMLQHAWPNLLSQQARVIPGKAEFFVAGVQCNHLNARYQLGREAKKLLNIKEKMIHVLTPGETYDCEDLHHQKDIKYLTKPESVLVVDFNDLENIEKHLNRTEPYEVELQVTEHGICNVFIGWFNLYLTDSIIITTDPRAESKANAWQQAVFHDEPPSPVTSGDSIKLEFLMNKGSFKLKPRSNAIITKVSPDVVRFLNDEDFIETIKSCIPMATIFLGQTVDMSQTNVADLCPFPLFGMLLMKRGASSLLCCAKKKQDKQFLIDVFKKNNVPLEKVTILIGSQWTVKDLNDEKYHTIFAHFLELGGDIDYRLSQICDTMKHKHLHTDGLFIPADIKVVGQVVSSNWIEINNILFDANVSKLKMSEFMNKYSVSINYHIDYSTLKYVPLTEPVNICSYDSNSDTNISPPHPITKEGTTNAILCSYNIQLMKDMKWTSTSKANSFIDGMVFLTASQESLCTGGSVQINMQREISLDGSIKLSLYKHEE